MCRHTPAARGARTGGMGTQQEAPLETQQEARWEAWWEARMRAAGGGTWRSPGGPVAVIITRRKPAGAWHGGNPGFPPLHVAGGLAGTLPLGWVQRIRMTGGATHVRPEPGLRFFSGEART